MLSFRKILSFRSPIIHRLEYIDIVIDEKVLLLLTWDFEKKYSVSIPSIGKVYCNKSGAVIVKIPSHIHTVLVLVRNGWRKRKIQIQLAKVKLDSVTASMLIQQFQPFVMLQFQIAKPFVSKQIVGMELPAIAYRISNITVMSTNISFKDHNLSYHN